MKKYLLLLMFAMVGWISLYAQIPDGSDAPNFTATDLNGNSHNLYNILDSGYTVFLDVSATWCGPCWGYHNSGALENLYDEYGPNGKLASAMIPIPIPVCKVIGSPKNRAPNRAAQAIWEYWVGATMIGAAAR